MAEELSSPNNSATIDGPTDDDLDAAEHDLVEYIRKHRAALDYLIVDIRPRRVDRIIRFDSLDGACWRTKFSSSGGKRQRRIPLDG